MKKFLILLSMLLLLFSCSKEEFPGAIYGSVKLIGSSDYSNILIEIEGTFLTTKCEESGLFVILDVPAGNYSVIASKEGFISQKIENIIINSSQATLGIDFELISINPPNLLML